LNVNDAFGSSQFDRRENELWPLAKDRKRRRDALGFGKAVEALMKIYHAFIFGRLIRLAGSKANQFAAQGREGFSLHDPDDDIEFRKEQHRARLLVGVTIGVTYQETRVGVMGCSRYPTCRGTRDLTPEEALAIPKPPPRRRNRNS